MKQPYREAAPIVRRDSPDLRDLKRIERALKTSVTPIPWEMMTCAALLVVQSVVHAMIAFTVWDGLGVVLGVGLLLFAKRKLRQRRVELLAGNRGIVAVNAYEKRHARWRWY